MTLARIRVPAKDLASTIICMTEALAVALGDVLGLDPRALATAIECGVSTDGDEDPENYVVRPARLTSRGFQMVEDAAQDVFARPPMALGSIFEDDDVLPSEASIFGEPSAEEVQTTFTAPEQAEAKQAL